MLESDFYVTLTVTFSVPPGTTREKATGMLAQGGVNVPLGLLQYVRKAEVNVVDAPLPPELRGGPQILR